MNMVQMQTQTRMESRNLKKLLPGLYPAITALGESANAAGLDASLIGLVNLRASQINGCAYCVQDHISELEELGVPPHKMNLVVVWREAGIFSEREEAALAWTEALTLVAETHVPDEAYDAARSVFSDLELAGLTAAISTINVWNRVSIAYRYAPEI
jgi:AhpD family alkylhydroperoxidase